MSALRNGFAFVGILTLVLSVFQLINLVTLYYNFTTVYSDTVAPGADPQVRGLDGDVWMGLIPQILIGALVMFSLVRWVVSGSDKWYYIHLIVSVAVVLGAVAVLIASAIIHLANSKWQNENNLASDERLCCLISPSGSVPGCPVLINPCVLSDSTSAQHWNAPYTWWFVLLLADAVFGIVHFILSYYMGTEGSKGEYETVSQSINSSSVESGVSVQAKPTELRAGVFGSGTGISFQTIVPINTQMGAKSHHQ